MLARGLLSSRPSHACDPPGGRRRRHARRSRAGQTATAKEGEPCRSPPRAAREVLPIPDHAYDGPVYEDAKDPGAKFPPIEPLRPPVGAPNVLIILLDDVGFGASS